MKNLVCNSFIIALFFTIVSTNTSTAQSNSGSKKSVFELSFKVPSSSKQFKANVTSVVVNHEEQYGFADFKKAVKKNKSLTFTTKQMPSNAFKAGSTYDLILFAINGKSLKLHGVKVKKNQQKGNERIIKIEHEGVK